MIQPTQCFAGEVSATTAKLCILAMRTQFNFAGDTGFRFVPIIATAARTFVLRSLMRLAQRAIHATGSDQLFRTQLLCLILFERHVTCALPLRSAISHCHVPAVVVEPANHTISGAASIIKPENVLLIER